VVAAVIAFLAGYVLGARAGEEGLDELKKAWQTISSSGEVKDLLAGGFSIARDIVSRGGGMLAERLPATEQRLTRVA
jgi:hypothetical protein